MVVVGREKRTAAIAGGVEIASVVSVAGHG